MSVFEAIKSAGWANHVQPHISWVDAEQLGADNTEELLSAYDAVVVPGGFGGRGVEGKIAAATYAMERRLPYLGLCLGMQVAVIALARRIGLTGANSTEIEPQAAHPVIDIMADQKHVTAKGGTMRLGDYPCELAPGSSAAKAYGTKQIVERHRHRYELNNHYRQQLEAAGLVLAGLSPDGQLVELIEMEHHPFFMASQFHPEFKSRPNRPHPMFDAFIKATLSTKLAGAATPIV